MKLIFLGPPGAGKGTMAGRLAKAKGLVHISTGDIFRAAIRDRTPLGVQVKSILDSGALVPDDLTVALIEERLAAPDLAKGFILDGFPRTIPQAESLEKITAIDRVLNFVLDEDEVVRRLSGRRVHPASGRTYHVIFSPPRVEGADDETGEALETRPDDMVDAIRNRMKVYNTQTAPLIDFYSRMNLLVDVNAAPSPDKVEASLAKLLEG